MSVELEIKNRIANLISAANAKTGGAETDLTSAVSALVSGFGQGGGIKIGENSVTPNFLNLFYALENGTAVTGEFTMATALPSTETLIFDSGLDEIKGIFYIDCDYNYTADTRIGVSTAAWGLYMRNPDETDILLLQSSNTNHAITTGKIANYGTHRIDGGSFYITSQYGGNITYTTFAPGHRYKWVAW